VSSVLSNLKAYTHPDSLGSCPVDVTIFLFISNCLKGGSVKNHQLSILICVVIFLSACTPSDSQIAEAIAKTEQASPSDTSDTSDTSVASPSSTITPMPDTSVINENPRHLILEDDEMPSDGDFYLAYENPDRNWEIIDSRGSEDGTLFIEEAGRVDGWTMKYEGGIKSSRNPTRYPDYVNFYSVLNKSSYGSEYEMHENGDPCDDEDGKMSTVEQLDLGDESYLCLWKEMTSSGQYQYEYVVFLRYRNIFMSVTGGGFEGTFDKEKVIEIAELQMEKLSSFPLQSEVTFYP
jgi:hypothetical protein